MKRIGLIFLVALAIGCGGPPGPKGKAEKDRPPRPAMDN